jgi:fibronectin-binding autotransporter adhesin
MHALLVALVALGPLTGAAMAVDITWNGSSGVWNQASNWTPANIPDAAGEVAILPVVALPYTADLNVTIALDEVHFQDAASTLRLGGQSITLLQAAGLTNAGTILTNGAVSTLTGNVLNQAGGRITVQQSQRLNLAGPALVNDGAILVNNTGAGDASLYFPFNVAVSGAGDIRINGDNESDQLYGAVGVVVTQDAGHLLHGGGAVVVGLVNHGTVQADKATTYLILKTNPKTNDGTLTAVSGAVLKIDAITVTNAGGALLADGGDVQLSGGVNIVGGTLRRTGASQVVATGAATLTDVTIALGSRYTVNHGTSTTIAGTGLVNGGTVWVNDTGTYDANLYFPGSVTVSGAGDIYLNGDNESDQLYGLSSVVVTQEAGHTLHGGGAVNVGLTNHGTVQADKAGVPLVLKTNAKTNDGVLQAVGGAVLRVSAITVTNAGGTLLADGGDVQLTGSANIAGGTLSRTGTSQVVGTGAATLTDVTITPGTRYTVNTSTLTTIAGTSLVNDGTIWVNDTGGYDASLYFPGNVIISGAGEIYINGDNESDQLYGAATVVVTQQAGHTLHGGGAVNVGLTNHGMVQADKVSSPLVLKTNSKTNDGTLRAVGGAVLKVNGITLTNGGGLLSADGGDVQVSGSANIVGGTLSSTGTSQLVAPGPATLTDVTIASGSRYTVNQSTSTTIAGTSLVNNGTIWVNHTGGFDSSVYFPGSVTVSGAGDIYINGDNENDQLYCAAGVVVTQEAGHTVHGGGGLNVPIVNLGTVRADKATTNLVVNRQGFDNQGTAEASGGAELRFNVLPANYAGRTLTGGTWRAFENSRIRFNGAYIDTSAAGILLHGAGSMIYANYQTTDALAGFADNRAQGSFTLEAGRAFTRSGPFHNAGTVAVMDSSAFTVSGANTYSQTGGATRVDGHLTATAINISAGWLTGRGTVTADVTSSGWVGPGASAGTLTVEGDYVQGAFGRLQVEIGGTDPGESDLLVVTGNADLAGYLSVVALPGLTLEDGDSIRVLACSSLQGGFAHATGLCPVLGICLDIAYLDDGVILVARTLSPAGIEDDPALEQQPEVTDLPSDMRLFAQSGLDAVSLLRLDLPDPSAVRLELFDVAGRCRELLLDGQLAAGSYTFECGGRSSGRSGGGIELGSGVYFARARTQSAGERVTKTVRLVILK